jgi:3-oxoacyl-[acyl-carrier protein] reductase
MLQNQASKVAIVTGGGTGIGRATALRLARDGHRVAVVYSRSAADAADTVQAIVDDGGDAFAVKADISDDVQVNDMVAAVLARWGRINYLVNNAAITEQLPFERLDLVTEDIWHRLFAINLIGTFNCCRASAPHLQAEAGSAIVNVGSIAGETGYGSSLPYAVSKSAVHGLTKSLARALAPAIRVNCIAPGPVETRWWSGYEEKMSQLAGQLPLQRISTPHDIADLIVHLLTAPSVTGQIVKAENGQTL